MKDPYREIAPIYDAIPASPATWAVRIMHKAGVRSFLDFGCGTGVLLYQMRALGCPWRLEGSDISPAMIAVARRPRTRPRITWTVGDMRKASDARFDAVGCFGDAINHLLSPREVLEAFRAAAASLLDSGPGLYLFDSGMKMIPKGSLPIKIAHKWSIILNGRRLNARVRTAGSKFDTHCVITHKDGSRHATVIHERFYSRVVLTRLLHRAGFVVRSCSAPMGHVQWVAQLDGRLAVDASDSLPLEYVVHPSGRLPRPSPRF